MTSIEARDRIFTLFLQEWKLGAPLIVGYVPEVAWQNNERKSKVDLGKYWCRTSVQFVDSSQTSLSVCVGQPGQRRFTDIGLVFVQVFGPTSDPESNDKTQKLAEVARNAFRHARKDDVWFRNSRINDIPREGEFTRFNVVAEFQYDETF